MELFAVGLATLILLYATVLFLLYGNWKRSVRLFRLRVRFFYLRSLVKIRRVKKEQKKIHPEVATEFQ